MNLTEVEIVMSSEELLKALWWGERNDAQISFGLTGLDTEWRVKSLYLVGKDEKQVRLTIERKDAAQPPL